MPSRLQIIQESEWKVSDGVCWFRGVCRCWFPVCSRRPAGLRTACHLSSHPTQPDREWPHVSSCEIWQPELLLDLLMLHPNAHYVNTPFFEEVPHACSGHIITAVAHTSVLFFSGCIYLLGGMMLFGCNCKEKETSSGSQQLRISSTIIFIIGWIVRSNKPNERVKKKCSSQLRRAQDEVFTLLVYSSYDNMKRKSGKGSRQRSYKYWMFGIFLLTSSISSLISAKLCHSFLGSLQTCKIEYYKVIKCWWEAVDDSETHSKCHEPADPQWHSPLRTTLRHFPTFSDSFRPSQPHSSSVCTKHRAVFCITARTVCEALQPACRRPALHLRLSVALATASCFRRKLQRTDVFPGLL